MRKLLCVVALIALAGCSRHAGRIAAVATPQGWRDIATDKDRARIRNWRAAWTSALAREQAGGHAREIAAMGATLRPDTALPDPRPPEGAYRCRVTKLGAQVPGTPSFRNVPFTCRIRLEGDILSFAKLDGVQRPVGLLFPDGQARMVFLGSLMLSDETVAMQYGRDPDRDMAGILERVGARRWRLVLPYPRWESTLDVIDLVPLK